MSQSTDNVQKQQERCYWVSTYAVALEKCCDFNGRSNRKEYWIFMSVTLAAILLLDVADGILSVLNWHDLWVYDNYSYQYSFGLAGLLNCIYMLGMIVPGLAISVRRLHDTGRNGGWMWLLMIPLFGWAALLLLLVQPSNGATKQFDKQLLP
jgi:uncharacterized membrane protein YhaH (DUF805 family)